MNFLGKSITSINDLNRDELEILWEKADLMCAVVNNDIEKVSKEKIETIKNCCKGKVMACAFYEPSTRTNCSFTAAMQRLGGSVFQIASSTSSVAKGETLEDTVRCLQCYADIIVLRHPKKGAANQASSVLKKPLFNAGDGAGEHPTQALLDLYTIQAELGKIDGLEISLVGDLRYGRTTHSLAKLLSRYEVKMNLVSPLQLAMPKDVVEEMKNMKYEKYETIDKVISTTDIIYMTRIQKERFENPQEYENVKDSFILDIDTMKKAKKDCKILHPLPRVNEIAVELDNDPRAAYFRQMENGMYVRMALIALSLGCL